MAQLRGTERERRDVAQALALLFALGIGPRSSCPPPRRSSASMMTHGRARPPSAPPTSSLAKSTPPRLASISTPLRRRVVRLRSSRTPSRSPVKARNVEQVLASASKSTSASSPNHTSTPDFRWMSPMAGSSSQPISSNRWVRR
jgi:hypothetical protein